ncbi:MAG: hypothetical protein WD810_06440 [Solirubrobacterales bacterium]
MLVYGRVGVNRPATFCVAEVFSEREGTSVSSGAGTYWGTVAASIRVRVDIRQNNTLKPFAAPLPVTGSTFQSVYHDD